MTSAIQSTVAELRSISDQLERQTSRVDSLIQPFRATGHDDVITALEEAERQLAIAKRAVERSVRTIDDRR